MIRIKLKRVACKSTAIQGHVRSQTAYITWVIRNSLILLYNDHNTFNTTENFVNTTAIFITSATTALYLYDEVHFAIGIDFVVA